jgi:hypothetical protein
MPDDNPGEDIKKESIQQSPDSKLIGRPPATPDNPPAADAQPISAESVNADIKGLENRIDNRMRRAEIWMLWLTGAIVFSGFCSVAVGILQWSVMRGQLGEMKSGGTDTHNLAVSARKQAAAMDTGNDRAKLALDASIQASRTDQRAWVGITEAGTPAKISEGEKMSFSIKLLNSGNLLLWVYSNLLDGGCSRLPIPSTLNARSRRGHQSDRE